MCGIAGQTGTSLSKRRVEAALRKMAHRGPDGQGVEKLPGAVLGHVRLAIQGLGEGGAQPMRRGAVVVTYNGELWNAEALRAELKGRIFETTCDTEVVAHALDEWGEYAIERFEGMFALAWWKDGRVWIARDSFGEVPLHYVMTSHGWAFASELKGLSELGQVGQAKMLGPGVVMQLGVSSRRYYLPTAPPGSGGAPELREALRLSAEERTVSDVPVCCLLSGGVDSSVIAALLRPHFDELVAYTAVFDEKSRDLRCAREVAERLEIRLVEVKVEAPTADDLAEVVRTIEMPFKAQVEIGYPCLKLAAAMRSDGFRVTYSGEGSDELWASYGFAYHGLKKADWHLYRRDLFLTQASRNFARCNKAFLAHGIECRLPFLNRSLVELALGMPRSVVEEGGRQKAVLLRAAEGLIPQSVLDRPKLAFQDGMGLKPAAARAVADPLRYYRAIFQQEYG